MTFACIFLLLFFNPILKNTRNTPDLFTLNFEPNKEQVIDSRWVFDVLKYIESTGARNPLILTSFNHFVFAYYSDHEAELFWPLRKDYIDGLDRDFFIITEDSEQLRDRCITFLPEEKMSCLEERTMKHFDRAAKLTRIDLGKVKIYQFISGHQR